MMRHRRSDKVFHWHDNNVIEDLIEIPCYETQNACRFTTYNQKSKMQNYSRNCLRKAKAKTVLNENSNRYEYNV
jgi:hypothetical protein